MTELLRVTTNATVSAAIFRVIFILLKVAGPTARIQGVTPLALAAPFNPR